MPLPSHVSTAGCDHLGMAFFFNCFSFLFGWCSSPPSPSPREAVVDSRPEQHPVSPRTVVRKVHGHSISPDSPHTVVREVQPTSCSPSRRSAESKLPPRLSLATSQLQVATTWVWLFFQLLFLSFRMVFVAAVPLPERGSCDSRPEQHPVSPRTAVRKVLGQSISPDSPHNRRTRTRTNTIPNGTKANAAG